MAVAEKELRSIGYMAELIGELRRQPEKIAEAMEKILTQQRVSDEAKERLHDKEGSLLQSGVIDGKNAEIRSAQLRDLTREERTKVRDCAEILETLKIELKHEQDKFSAFKAIAQMLGGE